MPGPRGKSYERDWGGAAFGALVGLAALILGGIAFEIPVRPVDVVLGPRLFPLAIMVGLAALGGATAIAALTRPERRSDDAGTESAGAIDWRALGYILLGVVAFAVAVETAGFVVAAALLFVAVARGFGSARTLRDAVLGLFLAGAVFVAFVYGLGLDLPGPALGLGA